jgi:phosphoserine phosphatase RsbU/P
MSIESGHILVVDDNRVNRMILTRALQELGYMVSTAENGRQALELLRAGEGDQTPSYDVVLLDILMPEMDGYETLAHIKADGALRHVPVIMISAVDELDSVVQCIEMGAEDYLPKEFNPTILQARIGACLEKKRLRDKEQLYLRGLERELEIGRQIQASFLPDKLPQPSGWQIASFFRPAREVAGDFYDLFPLAGGELAGLVVGDVSGKGVGAALFMALFRSLLRAYAERNYGMRNEDISHSAASLALSNSGHPHSIFRIQAEAALHTVKDANDYIARTHARASMFATIFFGVLDLGTGSLVYINGGHDPPVLVRQGGSQARLKPTGPAVGLMPHMQFHAEQAQLEPGDTLVIYTDGVTDAHDPQGGFFTESGLLSLLEEPAPSVGALLQHLELSLNQHIATASQFDDITVLAIRRLPSAL